MKLKKWMALGLAVCLVLTLAACSSDTPVYVQSVRNLAGIGGIAPGDTFGGMVVSENVTEIQKDSEKTIKELFVKEGQDVKEGEPLFSYDTEELQLTLDKQKLELEQLLASIENYKTQIAQMEKERNNVGGTAKLEYTIQIQTTQVDLKEAEINAKTKEGEVKKSEDLLEHATVTSPVQGRVQAITESGTDEQSGKPLPYITIQKMGSYRVKGVLGELQRGGLREGDKVKIISRTDPNATWTGTVILVDYENPIGKNDQNGGMIVMGGGSGSDEMTNASKYPFYVKLDSTEGLVMGQHLYMKLDTGDGEAASLSISSAFIAYEEDGAPYVWAEKNGKLEKRTVTLGEVNDMMGTVAILEGLTEDDFIAFPDETVCRSGAPTTHEEVVTEETGDASGEEMMPEGGEMMPEGGEMMPEGGEMAPEGDMNMDIAVLPEGGEMAPEGETAPEQASGAEETAGDGETTAETTAPQGELAEGKEQPGTTPTEGKAVG